MKNILSKTVSHTGTIYRITALLVTLALLMLMFPQSQKSTHYDYSIGGFWSGNDLYAPYDFAVIKNSTELERETAVAKSQSLLYYHRDSAAYAVAREHLAASSLSRKEQQVLRRTLDSIYSKGYMELPDDIVDIENHTIVLLSGNIGEEHTAQDFVSPLDIESQFLADSILVPSIRYDAERTRLELDSRLSQTRYTSDMVQTGELIIAKGERITEEKAAIIQSFEAENDLRFADKYNPMMHYLGEFLLGLMAFLTLYMFLKITRHPILEDDRKVTFVLTIVLLMAALTSLILRIEPAWILLAPLCIGPILMRVFFDMRVALYVHLVTIIVLGNMVPNSFEFTFYQLITGMITIISVKNFEKRSNFFIVSGLVFCSYSIIYLCGLLTQDTSLAGLDWQRFVIFFLNATLVLLSYPLIYIFEKLFGLTTDLTLLEISSTNTPALRELSRKAPGTFQHSMQVANISEDLINEIGGNALLARVGAMYHDIGKTNSSIYFTENQNTDYNPHSELDCEDSVRIIIQHVRDGVDLAKKYRLPGVVTDFIRTHHGTTKTGYFFSKYKMAHPDEDFDESMFQYPGPRPFSRETAVVMLVDSVEAACKSLPEPNKENISRLIDKVINEKIADNQLSNCDITFYDISRIREILTDKMLSVYHVRIAYPVKN